jgi:hypothetical protein
MKLSTVVNNINKEHQLAVRCAGDAVRHALKCGEYLAEVKAETKSKWGASWGDWVKQNLQLSVSTADRYVKAYLSCDSECAKEYLKSTDDPTITGLLNSVRVVNKDSGHDDEKDDEPDPDYEEQDDAYWPDQPDDEEEYPDPDEAPDIADAASELSRDCYAFLNPEGNRFRKINEIAQHMDQLPERKRKSMEESLKTLAHNALRLADMYKMNVRRVK